MVICTFTNMNTNACDQKKLMLQICLSYLQSLIMNISFVSLTCISHWHICFRNGLSVAVNEIFVGMDTHLHLVRIKMCISINNISVVENEIYHERLK